MPGVLERPELFIPDTPEFALPEGSVWFDGHNHSTDSYDGGITYKRYRAVLLRGSYLAITDHNLIGDVSKRLKDEFGPQVFLAEEVETIDPDGKKVELLGWDLVEELEKGDSTENTAQAMREQGAIICAPHPEDPPRKGASRNTLELLHHLDLLDAVEMYNGRTPRWKLELGMVAGHWAMQRGIAVVAGSDAHGNIGWGKAGMVFPERPTRDNLVELLHSEETKMVCQSVGLPGFAYPKWNKYGPRRLQRTVHDMQRKQYA